MGKDNKYTFTSACKGETNRFESLLIGLFDSRARLSVRMLLSVGMHRAYCASIIIHQFEGVSEQANPGQCYITEDITIRCLGTTS